MTTNTQTTELQAAIAKLVAAHGAPDVLRAVADAIRKDATWQAECGQGWQDDADESSDDDEAAECQAGADAFAEYAQIASDNADDVESAADRIDDARVDLNRALDCHDDVWQV